jgi:hypothetical protein
MFAMTVAWSLATPVFSAPDEPAHVVKAAAVVSGQLTGSNMGSDGVWRARIPASLAELTQRGSCTKHRMSRPGSCVVLATSGQDREVLAQNAAGTYHPTYYALVGWPLVFAPDATGILLSRVLSGLVCSLLLTAAAYLACGVNERHGRLVTFAAVMPSVLFLSGSVNPNGFEACAALVVWVGLLSMAIREPRQLPPRTLPIVGVSALLLVMTRPLSPGWFVLAVAVAATTAGTRQARRWAANPAARAWAGVAVTGCLLALAWMYTVNMMGLRGSRPRTVSPTVWLDHEPWFLIVRYFEVIGTFGWNDTRSPMLVYGIWTLLLLAAGGVAAARGDARLRISFATVTLLLVALPATSDFVSFGQFSFVWQGRYSLPIAMGIPALALVALARSVTTSVERPAALRVLALTIAVGHVAAFYWTLARYVHGRPGGSNVFDGPWSPPGGSALALALLVAGAGTLAWRAGWPNASATHRSAHVVPLDPDSRAENRPATSVQDQWRSTQDLPAVPSRVASPGSSSSSDTEEAMASGDRPSTT